MNKIIPALIFGVIIGIGFSPVMAESIEDLQKIIAQKDAVLMEQVKVIMMLKDNYKASYPDFDKTKYKSTDGFPTEWLDGERAKIKSNCQAESLDGYQSPWCKFVK